MPDCFCLWCVSNLNHQNSRCLCRSSFRQQGAGNWLQWPRAPAMAETVFWRRYDLAVPGSSLCEVALFPSCISSSWYLENLVLNFTERWGYTGLAYLVGRLPWLPDSSSFLTGYLFVAFSYLVFPVDQVPWILLKDYIMLLTSRQATGNTFNGENGSNVRPGDWPTVLGLPKVVPYRQWASPRACGAQCLRVTPACRKPQNTYIYIYVCLYVWACVYVYIYMYLFIHIYGVLDFKGPHN